MRGPSPMTPWLRTGVCALVLLCASAGAQAPGDVRVALVIGNAAYPGDAALGNPVNDALAMAATLKGLGFKVVELRERINENLRLARHKLLDAEDAIKEKTREMARATDDYVHEHPWKSVAIGTGLGVILGMLISRR